MCAGVSRRGFLGTGVAAAGALACAGVEGVAVPKGKFKQAVSLWCFNGYMKKNNVSLDAFLEGCKGIGIHAIDLMGPGEWDVLKKHNMVCSMGNTHGIPKGLNRVENHDECLGVIRKNIDAAAIAGVPNVVTFSGNAEGMSKEEGLKNCIAALKKIAPYAEEKKVTINLEFLNSINHKDYMADTTAWNVELVRGVNSPRVKVLYDIYHAGMMKEDPIRDISTYADCWGHYHTGGVPGRAEIDLASQTIDYRKVMQAIAATGFEGYVAHEFVPKGPDPMKSLREAFEICAI